MPSPYQSPLFKKKASASSLDGMAINGASAYLAAVQAADAKTRKTSTSKNGGTPASTPALSFSSTATSTSSDASSSYGSKYHHQQQHTHGAANGKGSDGVQVYDPDVSDGTGLVIPLEPPTSSQVFHTVHSEFGHCDNQQYRHTSSHPRGTVFDGTPKEQDPAYYILFTTYLSYLWLIALGHCKDFFGKRFFPEAFVHLMERNGYAALCSDFDSFYTRRLKGRLDDCFSLPVTGVPGRTIVLLDRSTKDFNLSFQYSGTHTRALNVSSYNYLGFAQARGGCADAVEHAIHRYGLSALGARLEGGTLDLHVQAEALVARFVGQEDAIVTSMGFATNSTNIPALVGKGCLVISDDLNHASIRFGVRVSGAQVRMFKHNDMKDLEKLLREVISQGQPKTHRPWKKIMVIVEGLYSMEGTLVDLPRLVELKKKYKFYLYVDEAHSIGAIGPNGRGVCDYFNIDPRNIDILMGTFTKSFGAAGGYISGSKALIQMMRLRTHAGGYAEAMSPVVLTQTVAAIASIMGIDDFALPSSAGKGHSRTLSSASSTQTVQIADKAMQYRGPAPSHLVPDWLGLPPHMRDGSEGRERLRRLAFNVRYLSRGLKKLGFITYGHTDSPIIPLLLFNPGKMGAFSRLMRDRRTPIVVVVVAYPATPLVTSRVRFCLSASHIKSDVDEVLRACDEYGDLLDLKHGQGERWPLERIINNAVELVRGE